MQTREEITQNLLALSLEDKYFIADMLEVELLANRNISNAWNEEIKKRLADYDNGNVNAVDAMEMLDKIEAHLKGGETH